MLKIIYEKNKKNCDGSITVKYNDKLLIKLPRYSVTAKNNRLVLNHYGERYIQNGLNIDNDKIRELIRYINIKLKEYPACDKCRRCLLLESIKDKKHVDKIMKMLK